jgi:ketosteroid isomerase-like protein
MWLGSELYFQERYDEAASVLRRVLAADAANPGALNMLGYTLKESGDAAGAEKAFLDYIRVAPHEGNPYDSYGEFLLDAGRLDEAEAQFTKALARAPNLTASQNHLVRIAIMRATDGFVAAVNNGDLDAYMDFYTANAVMSMPNGTELVGRDAIREAIGALFASGPISIESETQENVPMGDEHVYQRTALTTHIGNVTEQGSATHIWAKTDDGWKITRDTWTSAPATPVTTVADPVDNRAIVETAYANFAAGDVEAFLSILDPNVTWTDAEGYPYAGTYVGPDALLEGLIARIGAEWDDYTAVPTTYIAAGDRVVALGDYSGTYKATGRSVEAPFAHVWHFEDGKVVSFRQFTDGPPWERAITP